MLASLKVAAFRNFGCRLSRKRFDAASLLLLKRRNSSSRDIFPDIHYPFAKELPSQLESGGLSIDFDSDQTSLNLSPHIVEAMMEESVKRRDFKTSKLLMQQYSPKGGSQSASVMTKTLELHLSDLNFEECESILRICTKTDSLTITTELTERCFSASIQHLQWKTAHVCLRYMLAKQMSISSEALSFTLSGLMGYKYPKGAGYVLELVGSLLQHEKDDILQSPSWSLSLQPLAGDHQEQANILQPALIKTMEIWLKRCRNQSIVNSPSLGAAQLLVSLSLGTGQAALAAEFTRKAVIALDRRADNANSNANSELSVVWEQKQGSLSLLQSLTQITSTSQTANPYINVNNSEKDVSVDVSLLQLAIDRPPNTHNGKHETMTPFAAGDYFSTLFALESRLQGAAHILPQGVEALPTDLLVDSLKPLQRIYSTVVDFLQDESRLDMTVTLTDSIYERRLWRVLCDEVGGKGGVGLRCRVNRSPSMTRPSQLVLKKEMNDYNNKGGRPFIALDQLLREDYTHLTNNSRKATFLNNSSNLVKLSPLPIYWPTMKKMMMELSPFALSAVAMRLVNNHTSNSNCSVSWLLLVAEVMKERRLSLPTGFVRGGVAIAAKDHDFYGLLELLYLAIDSSKTRLSTSSSSSSSSNDEEESKEEVVFTPLLWQQAMTAALSMRRHVHSLRSYEENVLEVLGMRKSTFPIEAALTRNISRGILRFLVLSSDENSSHRTAATAKSMLYKSLTDDTAIIGKSECLAASMLLLKAQVSRRQSSQSSTSSSAWSMFSDEYSDENKSDVFQLTSPLFFSDLYLTPISMDRLHALRQDFRAVLQADSERLALAAIQVSHNDDDKNVAKLTKNVYDPMNSVIQFDQATRQENLPQGREMLLILVRQQIKQLSLLPSERRDMKRVAMVSNMAIHTACQLACNDERFRPALSLLMSALDLYPVLSTSAVGSKEKLKRKRQQQPTADVTQE